VTHDVKTLEMTMPTNDDALGRLSFEPLPNGAQNHLRRLAELRHPIADRQSLAEQLGAGADREESRLASRLRSTFEPEDFGLDTLQSALEKYRLSRGSGVACGTGLSVGRGQSRPGS